MDAAQIYLALSTAGGLATLGFTIYRYVRSQGDDLRAQLGSVKDQLGAFREHVAAEYVSRETMRQMLEPMTAGIRDLKTSIDSLGNRVDRIIDRGP